MQDLSHGNQGPWSDVYSVASTFYSMVTGITPPLSFERSIEDTLQPLSMLGVDLSESDEKAILHALNISIEHRTKSADKFIEELSYPKDHRYRRRYPILLYRVCSILALPFIVLWKVVSAPFILISYCIHRLRLLHSTNAQTLKTFRASIPQASSDKTNSVSVSDKDVGVLSSFGFDRSDIEKVDISKIPRNKQAYNMLINQFNALDIEHQKTLDELKRIQFQSEDRKTATIVLTVAEIIVGIGVGNIESSLFVGLSTLAAGLAMTGLGLFLSFRNRK